MIAKVIAHPDQIRWYAQSALSGFETLTTADAIENACHDLRRLLEYLSALDAANEAVLVSGIVGVKSGVRLELTLGQGNAGHQSDLKISGLPPV